MGLFEKMMGIAERYRDEAHVPHETVADAARQSPCERKLLEELTKRSEQDGGPVRLALRFTGTVQGVGFRWTNQALARDHQLCGWVRNLSDGSVDMEIQGEPATIGAHFARLHAYYSRFGNRIWLECAREIPCVEEADFDVRV